MLVVPKSFRMPKNNTVNTIIAFDGSSSCIRALQRFALIELNADFNITFVILNQGNRISSLHLDQAKSFFHKHGYKNINIKSTSFSLIKEIENNLIDQTDLLIFGSNPRWNLRNLISRSLLKRYLEHDTKYMLIG